VERKIVPREPVRSLAIATDRAPEFGGMIGERILVTRKQFVIAPFRLATATFDSIQ
jgi:hypothetical protein